MIMIIIVIIINNNNFKNQLPCVSGEENKKRYLKRNTKGKKIYDHSETSLPFKLNLSRGHYVIS